MTVIKRTAKSSVADLVTSIDKFNEFLSGMGEDDAVQDLDKAASMLKTASAGDEDYKSALNIIIDAFDGDHELNAYTFHRETTEWTEKEELAQVSSRVYTLAKRLLK